MRNFILAVAFVLAVPASARSITSFDEGWVFRAQDFADAETAGFDDSGWSPVALPHDWSIAGPFDKTALTGGAGAFLPTGVVWYRKHFRAPAQDANRRYFVELDGVMANSGVWINGHHLGHRPYGYIGLHYDLTPFLHFGGDNVIAVRADTARQPASRFYAGTGIHRHVRLIETDAVHLVHWGTAVTTPTPTAQQAKVEIRSEVVNDTAAPVEIRLNAALVGPDGKTAAAMTSEPASIAPGHKVTLTGSAVIADPKLWDIDHPELYRAVLRVMDGPRLRDEETVAFGVRDARFVPQSGFWLNGRNIKIKGVAVHADGGAFGMAVPLDFWRQRLTALKRIGVSGFRTAHNPASPEVMDLLDKMGFVVLDELFDVWNVGKTPHDYHLYFGDWHKIDAADFVRRDRNHPSVVLWSTGNEIHDTAYPLQSQAALRSLLTVFHREDPSRPATMALFRPNVTGDYQNGLADMLDVVGQNYREKELIAAHEEKPSRSIVGTENGRARGSWVAVRDYAPYAGYFVWAGFDYTGEADRGEWPMWANGAGLFDRTGEIKIAGMQAESWWSERPVIHVLRNTAPPAEPEGPLPTEVAVGTPPPPNTLFDDWTPKDLRTHPETIDVYSNCQEVEVYLNGRSLGRKALPADAAPRKWAVRFAPGTVRAVCLNAGKIAGEDRLRTAGKPARIVLSSESRFVGSRFDDLAIVRARMVDENGVVVPSSAAKIRFAVSKAGTFAAADNGNRFDLTPFASPERAAFEGRATVYVRGRARGAITVTATAPGLKAGSLRLEAK